MIPKKYERLVFSLYMSCFMSLTMSFVMTMVNVGPRPDFLLLWGRAFVVGISIAYPTTLVVMPLVRSLVLRTVRQEIEV